MRRFVPICLALISACALRQGVGNQSTDFTVPSRVDTLLARARVELGQLGYTVSPTEHEGMVLTEPRPIPDSLAIDTATTRGQLWVLRVTGANNVFSAGSHGTVEAFLIPPAGEASPGNVILQTATTVTATRTPALFRELQRVAGAIQAAVSREARP
jgi:hypothetical protein